MPDPAYVPDPADVQIVADALCARMKQEMPDESAFLLNGDYEDLAAAAVSALAAAGRLLPAGAETRTEWAVRWPGIDRDLADLRPVPEGGARATLGGNPGTELYRRSVSTWPDGSTWVGPWQPVPDTTTEEQP